MINLDIGSDIGQALDNLHIHTGTARFKLASIASPDAQAHGDAGHVSTTSPTQTPNRKRAASVAGLDTSLDGDADNDSLLSPNGEQEEGDFEGQSSRKRPVKRACNECRQQKVNSITVIPNTYLLCHSCDAMWCKIRGRRAVDVLDSI